MTFTTYDSGYTAVSVLTFAPDYSQGVPRTRDGQRFLVQWKALDGVDTNLVTGSSYILFKIFQTNVAPIIDSIRDTSITEGGYLKVFVIGRDYDFDQDGYPPRPKVTVDSTTLPLNATFTGLFSNIKTFEFRPDFTQSGNYAVRFYATDDTLRDTVTLHINVIEAGNQPAAFTVTLADTQVAIIGLPLNNRLTAIDPEHGAVTITSSALPANAVFADSGNGIAGFQFNPISGQLGAIYQVVFIAQDPLAAADTIITHYRVVAFMRGDANSDNRLDVSDIMFLVNYLYKHGRSPASFEAADVNFDQTLNLLDASFLTNYFYKAGPPPPSK